MHIISWYAMFINHSRRFLMANATYMTTDELASRLHYDPRYIREFLKDSVLFEGIHYIRPFGRRKILFIWETIERDMMKSSQTEMPLIPLARGGVCHG
jgi:hypothetical protein